MGKSYQKASHKIAYLNGQHAQEKKLKIISIQRDANLSTVRHYFIPFKLAKIKWAISIAGIKACKIVFTMLVEL